MKKIIIGIIILITLVASYFVLFKKENNETTVIDTVNGYKLESTSSEYYKSLFTELKTLYSKEYTDSELATLISKMFLADYLSLSTATSKNDVGGVDFIYESFKEDFIKISKTSIYKTVENNIYGNRKQSLPLVTLVDVKSITDSEFDINDISTTVKEVSAQISYKTDMGYQEEVTLLLVKTNDKYEVIKMD